MIDIYANMPQVREVELSETNSLQSYIAERKPFVVRGLVKDWPLVQAGLDSAQTAREYLLKYQADRPFVVSIGSPKMKGRIFYNEDMTLNIQTGRVPLAEIFERMAQHDNDAEQPLIYLASIDVHGFFPGLRDHNHVNLGEGRTPIESLWIGTPTRIAAHNDFPENLACCAVGNRRFTILPPDQFKNLYLGPIDNTPAGRAISMVDFLNPDFEAHPKFKDALEQAQYADLEPGDAIFIPTMWWHHVEGRQPFNILLNYWWRDTPRHLGQPQDALNHAIMAIRDLPEHEKMHWRDLFDHYVFGNDESVTAHIPKHAHSILGEMTAEHASRIRAFLLRTLTQ